MLLQIDPAAFANLGVGVAALVVLGLTIFAFLKFMDRNFDAMSKTIDRNTEAIRQDNQASTKTAATQEKLTDAIEDLQTAVNHIGRTMDRIEQRLP